MKNKILDNLPILFVCLVFLFAMTLVWNHAKAEDNTTDYKLYWMQMPMMCGSPDDVERYIRDNKFVAVNVSFGKENAKEDGLMVFVITYYINDKHQTLAVADTPNDPYRCMIFHTFDLKINSKLLPGLQT